MVKHLIMNIAISKCLLAPALENGETIKCDLTTLFLRMQNCTCYNFISRRNRKLKSHLGLENVLIKILSNS